MDKEQYLQRIKFTNEIVIDEDTLINLHEHHVFNVPFENIDIYYRRLFSLEIERIFEKVVLNFRGGFCYELNSIFDVLLRQIGFNSKIISARIIGDYGALGPEYDHMSVFVECNNKKYLADVGFGHLFIRPLEIRSGIQSDGRNFFMIQEINTQDYVVSMSSDKINFYKKYRFNLREVSIENFVDICLEKQTNPSSYFVKNIICTKPTIQGRLTIKNGNLIEQKNGVRTEKLIRNEYELRTELRNKFDILIK